MSPVHLARGDLLLGRGHGAQVEVLRPAHRARADDAGQRHRAVLHVAHAVELLLQDGGPAGTPGECEGGGAASVFLY